MKRILVASLIAMSASAFAQVTTSVTLGPYINCHVHNNTNKWIAVNFIDYDIMTYGGLKDHSQTCNFNCEIAPYSSQQFSGPVNSHLVRGANCSVRYRY